MYKLGRLALMIAIPYDESLKRLKCRQLCPEMRGTGSAFCSKPSMTPSERALLDLAREQHEEFARVLKDGMTPKAWRKEVQAIN